jgi:hypothetical protein
MGGAAGDVDELADRGGADPWRGTAIGAMAIQAFAAGS